MLGLTIAGTSFLVLLVTGGRTAAASPLAVDRDVQPQAMVLPAAARSPSRMAEASIPSPEVSRTVNIDSFYSSSALFPKTLYVFLPTQPMVMVLLLGLTVRNVTLSEMDTLRNIRHES
jgi:hypothetical protein